MTTSRTMVFTNFAEAIAPNAAERAALTGCPWHDVKAMLRQVGLRPTRQRMALGWILFAKGDRHITAEMLYEEATKAKVPVSLATVYNTLHQFTDVGLLRQVAVDGSKTFSTLTRRSIITSLSRARMRCSTSRTPTSSSVRPRCRRKATRSRASTWWCGCAAKGRLRLQTIAGCDARVRPGHCCLWAPSFSNNLRRWAACAVHVVVINSD